tara:strand:- start:7641 stop:8393 length:753 start_codon:yes stop_codon:yes gene_type:complete
MEQNIKASTFGSLKDHNLFFSKHVSISYDTLEKDNSAEYKILVQIEPLSVNNNIQDFCERSSDFDLVLTWHSDILETNNSKLFPFGTCWIEKDDRRIFPKNKNLSIIASHKNYAPGHILRHQIIHNYPEDLSLYGRGYKSIENKITALKDYRFSLIIENEYSNNWFTEKLIDCLVTGTVPIFWGCPNIHKFFDPRGFILFNNIDQIPKIKSECNESAYKNLLPFIKKNYHSALEYVDIFDRITKTIKNEI